MGKALEFCGNRNTNIWLAARLGACGFLLQNLPPPMTDEWITRLQAARAQGLPCALVTVAQTRGSVPREAGAKMIVFADGTTFETIGGGKFEALVIEASLATLSEGEPVLATYPLHEASADSFGAICGGEVTVLIEPQIPRERLVLVGAGHCARAIAKLARECGLHITVIDDRVKQLAECIEAHRIISEQTPVEFIRQHPWRRMDALVIVSRNYLIDREALAAALELENIGYIGMIGSRRKVQRVFSELAAQGAAPPEKLARIYAPIGLDIGADSPAEIAVSVVAEILQILRRRRGGHLCRLENRESD